MFRALNGIVVGLRDFRGFRGFRFMGLGVFVVSFRACRGLGLSTKEGWGLGFRV